MSRSYSTSSPYRTSNVLNIPVTTLAASCIAGAIYLIAAIMLLSLKSCPFKHNVVWFFCILVFAIVAIAVAMITNMSYPHHRSNNPFSLTASLLYSASIGMVFLGIIMAATGGICESGSGEAKAKGKSLFSSGHTGDYILWFGVLLAWPFQVVAHYYYG